MAKPASVYVTKVVNGNKTKIKLCSDCAQENDFGFGLDFGLNLQDFLSGMIKVEPNQALKCPKCGLDYYRFNKSGQLGCSECYQIFAQKINPIIKRVHGTIEHTGKIPKRTGGKILVLKQLQSLKDQLKKAIEAEEFERAAELRDAIKDLQSSALGGE